MIASQNTLTRRKMMLMTMKIFRALLLPMVTVAMDYGENYGRTEYCQWETFNATCRPEEIILMESGRYGRMRFGRCMREDHGSVGCSADVLEYMDRKCSGRRTCSIAIPDASLHANLQCPKEVMPYLEASYTCITVKSGSQHACSVLGGQPLKTRTGYIQPLPPVAAPDTKPGNGGSAGSATCPWLIQMHAGQKVNLTLISFRVDDESRDWAMSGSGRVLRCSSERVVVQDGNRSVELTLCGEKHRMRHLYLSEGNAIQLHVKIENRISSDVVPRENKGSFLIRYQVVGCPDISDFVNAWVIRRGDTAIVRCNFTGETFFLTCLDTGWKGELLRCSTGFPTKSSQRVEIRRPTGQSQGVLVIISLGVALGVALGVFLLFSLVACHRRRRKQQHRRFRTGERLLAESLSKTEPDERKDIVYTPIWAQPRPLKDPCGCRRYQPPSVSVECPCPLSHHKPNTLQPHATRYRQQAAKTKFCNTSEFSLSELPTEMELPVTSEFQRSGPSPTFELPMTSLPPTLATDRALAGQQNTSFTMFRPPMTSEAASTVTSAASIMTYEESSASNWRGQLTLDSAASDLDLIRYHFISADHLSPTKDINPD